MQNVFRPGETVYLLYWKRPEEKSYTRVAIYLTKKGRDRAISDHLLWGLVPRAGEMAIPLPDNMVSLQSDLL